MISFDPAAKCGLAWRRGDGSWVTRTVDGLDLAGIRAVVADALKDGVVAVACEDAFVSINLAVFKSLCRVQGIILAAASEVGLSVDFYPPITWKSAMLQHAGGYLPKGREAQKEASLLVARSLGADPSNDHEADAVCLAEYASTIPKQLTLGLKAKRKRVA